MIFTYEELKESVEDAFEMFYKDLKFTPLEVIPATLNEHYYGDGLTITKQACIHLFLMQIYIEKEFDTSYLSNKLDELLTKENIQLVKDELGDEYKYFTSDLKKITSKCID